LKNIIKYVFIYDYRLKIELMQWEYIMIYLPIDDLKNMILVNKQLMTILNNDNFWKYYSYKNKIDLLKKKSYKDSVLLYNSLIKFKNDMNITEYSIQKLYKKTDLRFITYNTYELKIIKPFEVLEISKEIKALIKLESLSVIHNHITIIPKEIGKLINLENLVLCHNKIEIIPLELKYLVNLRYLDINNNLIKEIPDEIGYLSNLTYLNLSNNKIYKIPNTISKLINLQYLNLRHNKIKEIPYEIGNLLNLYKLYLTDNLIENIPKTINNLINLERLELNVNRLTTIPYLTNNLIKLKKINLSHNKIKILTFNDNYPINLTHIHIHDNSISEVYIENIKFTKLEIFDIRYNVRMNPMNPIYNKQNYINIKNKFEKLNNNIQIYIL